MSKSSIEWTDFSLNPFVGCSKCSPACQNCFAERIAARLAKNPVTAAKYAGVVDDKGRWTGKISKLDLSCFDKLPKKSSRVFVGSMTDLFHSKVSGNWLCAIFMVMDRYPQHTFLVLTKRPKNFFKVTPRLNVMFGTTVCNQQEADEKIPQLLDFPTSRPFISVEPMLSEINISQYLIGKRKLSWVICGGETGPNARPMREAWVKDLRDQCLDAGIPYFFKSWGEWLPISQNESAVGIVNIDNKKEFNKVGKIHSGHLIDGVEYRQFPES